MDEEKYKILLSNIDGQIDENGEAIVSLLNSERTGFSKHKLEFLKWLEQNVNDVKDKVSSLILLVPNEYLPYNDFVKINDFYRATKGTLNTTLAVVHTYDSRKIWVKKLWSIETIIRANLYIQSVVNNIKKSNLSPAEALAYIHFKVSSIVKYTPSARQSHTDGSCPTRSTAPPSAARTRSARQRSSPAGCPGRRPRGTA